MLRQLENLPNRCRLKIKNCPAIELPGTKRFRGSAPAPRREGERRAPFGTGALIIAERSFKEGALCLGCDPMPPPHPLFQDSGPWIRFHCDSSGRARGPQSTDRLQLPCESD
jgi:hypothetical protein